MELATRETLADAEQRLTRAGVETPRVDAEILAAHVLGVQRARVRLVEAFTQEQAEAYEALISERARRVPLQHLTGRAGFRHLTLDVGPGVFVPRPETEQLVEWGLKRLEGIASPVVVDLCAGSGAVALALAHERPDATVHAVELDALAYAWLVRNVEAWAVKGEEPSERASVNSRIITLHHADATAPNVLAELNDTVDLVLSNPPYIPAGSAITPEVEHDPDAALWGGADGLDVVRGAIATAARLLKPGGCFAFEHAEQHTEAVRELLINESAWADIHTYDDLAGRPRGTGVQRR